MRNHPNRDHENGNRKLREATCDRHPNEAIIGLCASCLRERLEAVANISISLSSSAQASNANFDPHSSSSCQPELRRSKSFSVSQILRFGTACEPRRKSCDVRAKNTLLSLFHQDDRNHPALEINEDSETAAADLKPIKDQIDIDSRAKKIFPKDAKEFAGSFWLSASVFSKKFQKWRKKRVDKKRTGSCSHQDRDTRSEIAIDINPRFSLDRSRFSFEDPRISWDEPRVSWDGYLIGGRGGRSERFDGLMPVEEDSVIPGGSSQTRDYYEGPYSRKQSFEFNFQIPASTVSAELMKPCRGGKHERDSREWSSNSLREEYSENIESSFRHQSKAPPAKKSRRLSKAWSFFGFIHRRVGNSSAKGNGVELGADEYNPRICRSDSSVSSRSSFNGNGFERNGNRKKKEEVVLKRNFSSHVNNGLLRFYLPAMKGSRRSKYRSPHSITGSMVRLY